jgi:Tfp pilus assembly protein PilO
MREPIFLVALAMVAGTAIVLVKTIVGAIVGRGASHSELAQMREQLEQYIAAVEDAQGTLATQSAELAELRERLDFAERMLAQNRERPALGPGDKAR